MSDAAALLAIVTMGALLRIVPGIVWPRSGSDAGYHLLLRREILRNGGRMPTRIAAMALDERQTYPWLFHLVLARIPEAWLVRFPGLPSAMLDTGQVVIAWVLARAASGTDAHGATAATIAAALVATSPALLAAGIGPRAYDVTPRPLGEMLWSAGLAASGWFVAAGGGVPALILASGCSAAALLASKFAAQVLLFCLPPLALLSGAPSLLLVLPASLAAALVFSRGRYLDVLRGQIAHLRLYRQRLQYEHPLLANRARWRELFAAIVSAGRTGLRDHAAVKRALILIEGNGWIQMGLRNIALVLLVITAAAGFTLERTAWLDWLWLACLVPIVPACVTMLRGLRFLGEAERYLEYGVVPSSVLLALVLPRLSAGFQVFSLGAYLLVAVALYGWALARQKVPASADPPGSLEELRMFLAALPSGTRLLTVPCINLAFSLAWRLEHRFLTAMDTFVWAREYDALFKKYPWPSTDLERWRQRYGADYLVASRFFMLPQSGCTWDYGLNPRDCVFENTGYLVYRLPAVAV